LSPSTGSVVDFWKNSGTICDQTADAHHQQDEDDEEAGVLLDQMMRVELAASWSPQAAASAGGIGASLQARASRAVAVR
jgi:hypothetical protein